MRIVVLILCLLVCYVSLPITTRVVAQDASPQATEAEATDGPESSDLQAGTSMSPPPAGGFGSFAQSP